MMWLVYAISAAAVWGLDYSLGEKILKSKVSPVSLIFLQMSVGAIFFGILGSQTQLKEDFHLILSKKSVIYSVLFAILSFNLGNWLIFLSIQAKNATLAGLIELSYPIFTIAFTYLLFRESHVNLGIIVGGLMILAGVVVVSTFS